MSRPDAFSPQQRQGPDRHPKNTCAIDPQWVLLVGSAPALFAHRCRREFRVLPCLLHRQAPLAPGEGRR